MTYKIGPLELTCIYRAYDSVGQLLYIGKTVDFGARMRKHDKDSDWFFEFVDGGWVHCELVYGTEAEVLEIESHFIREEKPGYNVTHNVEKGRAVER